MSTARCPACGRLDQPWSAGHRPGCEHDRPTRVRLSRARGWRKPPGVVVVARPTRWGNPHRVDPAAPDQLAEHQRVIAAYADDLLAGRLAVTVADARRDLAGHDLACWCPLDLPCHADVLLAVAAGHDPAPAARPGHDHPIERTDK